MPFADVGRPAIGVSLLQAELRRLGRSSAIEYCNIDFADRAGGPLYATVSGALAPDLLVGEWVFAEAAFGSDRLPEPEEYLERVLAPSATHDLVAGVRGLRGLVDEYLDACVARVLGHRPRVVGLTTTFHQTCACLAMARRLKRVPDPPIVVFGGANCEGPMGLQLLESFPWIDAVFSGEADGSFPRWADAVLAGRPPGPIAGVRTRGDGGEQASPAVTDLDALPCPDYDDYFEQLKRSPTCRDADVYAVVETSRGCWWGVKHHCTFCGLNGDTMRFRSKTPERAYAEIVELTSRYGLRRVGCVDNILDLRYIDTLFPMLADSGLNLELFYEVKANLRHDHLVKLHAGGIRQIQPGVESFSTPVLKLMDKGVSALQNVQLLRWCAELGINCAYNVLAGFPGEPPEEYERMAEIVPLLAHLEPPMSTARLRLDRFSPFHDRSEAYGFRRVRPARAYFHVFPLGRRELHRLAYYFDYDYDDGRVPETYLEPLRAAVVRWSRQRFDGEAPCLDAHDDGQTVRITDSRPVATAPEHVFDGIAARVYARCDAVTSIEQLLRDPVLEGRAEALAGAVSQLEQDRLLLRDDGRLLALAVFRSRPEPDVEAALATTAAA